MDSSHRELDEVLTDFILSTQLSSIPSDVREHAKLVLLDTLGVVLASSLEDEPSRLAQIICGNTPAGTATVLRPGFPRTDPATAAFINGASGVFLEMDEGHRYFGTHAAIHVIPAAIAVGEMCDASGDELLASIIVGYDIGARMGGATKARAGINGHGTWGIVGGAAACARLLQLSPQETAMAMRLAAHLAGATSFRTCLEGATIRNAYVGTAGQAAVRACQLARAGFTALPDAAHEVFGRLIGERFDDRILTEELGQRFEVSRNFMKIYACCQWNHASLDALERILERQELEWASVERAEVYTYHPATMMIASRPRSPLQAKFSIPYAIAARLVLGNAGPDSFTRQAIRNTRVLGVAARVQVIEEPSMSARFPIDRAAEVMVHITGGETYRGYCANARGDFMDPHPIDGLQQKFRSLAGRLFSDEGVTAIERAVAEIDAGLTVRGLTDALAKGDQPSARAKLRV